MSSWYSSIDEVFPDFNHKNKSGKKKKYNDPICDLYNSRNNTMNNTPAWGTGIPAHNPQNLRQELMQSDSSRQIEPRVGPKQTTNSSRDTPSWVQPEENRYDIDMGAPVGGSEFERQFAISQPMQKNEYSDDDVKKIMNTLSSQEPDFLNDYRLEERNIATEYYPQDSDKVSQEYMSVRIPSETRPTYGERRGFPPIPGEYKHRLPEPNGYSGHARDKLDEYIAQVGGEFRRGHNMFPILDIILFAIAGCVFIFVLEQFVRLGMLLA